jgi:uncharacterized membrane protein
MSASSMLSQVWFDVLCCVAIGCVVGLLCRSRIILALLLSIFASVGWLMLGAWYAGTFSNQFSLQDPGGTVFWLGIPYLLLYFLPTVGAALVVTLIWRSRKKRAC